MPSHYIYLISSLPLLHFTQKPPFSFDKFLERCVQLIPEEDEDLLRSLPSGAKNLRQIPVIKAWLDFDTMLRNELVKIRASRRRIDPEKYLRQDSYAGPSIYHIALAAHRNPSVLEGERSLDEARWNYLEELAFGHYFDLSFLIIYAYKLLILERWQRIYSADKGRLLEEAVS
jgi:hypothetical protein